MGASWKMYLKALVCAGAGRDGAGAYWYRLSMERGLEGVPKHIINLFCGPPQYSVLNYTSSYSFNIKYNKTEDSSIFILEFHIKLFW